MNKRKFLHTLNSGMTLVELLVVVAIFMMVTGIVIFNYSNFRSTISTQNLVDAISLSVRKAQSYAIGARATRDDFTHGYGVHFTTQNANGLVRGSVAGSNKAFVLFTDVGSGGSADRMYNYDTSGGDPCGENISIGNECTEILRITTLDEISAIYLNDEITPIGQNAFVDVTFLRPNPDAYFCYKSDPRPTPPCERSTDISHVRIEVSNPQNSNQTNAIKTVTIWNTGQISTSSSTRSRRGDGILIQPRDIDVGPAVEEGGRASNGGAESEVLQEAEER
jgi:type II secretory pathway pseudopilin PulG